MLEYLIFVYGYPALFIGAALEGEFVPVLAGFAAYEGYLSLPAVIIVGCLGSIMMDQVYFLIGRNHDRGYLVSRPRLQKRIEKVMRWVDKNMIIPLVLFRFVYGVRSLTPIVLGAIGTPYLKFLAFDFIGAAFWTVGLIMAGYLFGGSAELIISDIKRYELEIVIAIALIFAAIWSTVYLKRRRRTKVLDSTSP